MSKFEEIAEAVLSRIVLVLAVISIVVIAITAYDLYKDGTIGLVMFIGFMFADAYLVKLSINLIAEILIDDYRRYEREDENE